MTIIQSEYERLIRELPNIEVGTDTYLNALKALEKLIYIGDKIQVEETSEPTPEPVTITTVPEPKVENTYTKEDVREILTDASKNGIKIQPIMQQFIPEGQPAKLSSIPVSSYAALVEAINNAG